MELRGSVITRRYGENSGNQRYGESGCRVVAKAISHNVEEREEQGESSDKRIDLSVVLNSRPPVVGVALVPLNR